MIKRLKMLRGIVLSAGRLKKNGLGIVMLLCVGLLLAGCSGSKSSDTGSYSGSVYTVKRGDTLYRISRATGTSVKEIARLNNISPPYTIEVGQKLKVSGGAKTSSGSGKTTKKSSTKTAAVRPSSSVPQSSWPPVGQRCWQWPASGKVILPYSTADGGNKGIDISLRAVRRFMRPEQGRWFMSVISCGATVISS
ncbi:Uncharacterized lipoprotein YgeR precursor [Citrobacter freundii]|uniref:Uncharacterized lipoprotein YgeR n=1 Tax=Citrobacter freundii TaxID=546 RepID=A0A7G2IR48_CITFR|nr:Uncharacterized lipoprotein YgeR precursor [Citrobacter freundii]